MSFKHTRVPPALLGQRESFNLREPRRSTCLARWRTHLGGELKDPPTMKKGEAVIARYDMPADADKYVICHYGKHSYRAIKLPAATQECDVFYSPATRVAKGAKATYGISDIVCH
jgi:hypothetical protein